MAGDINVIAIVKGEERYVFLFDDDSRAETLRTLGRYASDSELSFSWYDAAVLSQKVRKTKSSQVPSNTDGVNRLPVSGFCEDESAASDNFPFTDDFPPMDDLWIGDEPLA